MDSDSRGVCRCSGRSAAPWCVGCGGSRPTSPPVHGTRSYRITAGPAGSPPDHVQLAAELALSVLIGYVAWTLGSALIGSEFAPLRILTGSAAGNLVVVLVTGLWTRGRRPSA
jgi:hypothetical protein